MVSLWLKAYNFESLAHVLKEEIGATVISEFELLEERHVKKMVEILHLQLQKKRLLRKLAEIKSRGF